ncbi:MAG: DUF559 domain-containing protein [Hyphomicrobiales bacterium]|nr:DUF559 domain-containing protein [Hyphomicrobiales bacterium]
MVSHAREMRHEATDAEAKLWSARRNLQLVQAKFRRQVPLGLFIGDFVCFEARHVVEADGGQHAEAEKDRWRDRWFAENGYRTLRFWNNEILENLEGVLLAISTALSNSPPHPVRPAASPPSPARGEGSRATGQRFTNEEPR